jgi:hypothetical protein
MRSFTSKRKPWWKDGREYPEHLFIPDTQIKAGVPIEHVRWAAEYAIDHKPDVIVLAMDWWDLPSINSWESDHADFRMRSIRSDILAGLHGWDLFFSTLRREKAYTPTVVATLGNHERRFYRVFQGDRRHGRTFPGPCWHVRRTPGVTLMPFLSIARIDGIHYSHYFAQPLTGKPIGGTAINRLNKLKFSFTQGHVQIRETAEQHLANGQVVRGLVAGAFYQHDEEYRGPQANAHWRGILYKHEVRDGNYDLMEVSMDYLRRRYGGPRVIASGEWRGDEFPYDDADDYPA